MTVYGNLTLTIFTEGAATGVSIHLDRGSLHLRIIHILYALEIYLSCVRFM